jgi:hypothetical protein
MYLPQEEAERMAHLHSCHDPGPTPTRSGVVPLPELAMRANFPFWRRVTKMDVTISEQLLQLLLFEGSVIILWGILIVLKGLAIWTNLENALLSEEVVYEHNTFSTQILKRQSFTPLLRLRASWKDIVQWAEHHRTSRGEVLITLFRKYRLSQGRHGVSRGFDGWHCFQL